MKNRTIIFASLTNKGVLISFEGTELKAFLTREDLAFLHGMGILPRTGTTVPTMPVINEGVESTKWLKINML